MLVSAGFKLISSLDIFQEMKMKVLCRSKSKIVKKPFF